MISTGLEKLDQILDGGIKNGIIFDIYGANGTGKTQLALQITINFLTHGDRVLFLDTSGEFRPERMLQIMSQQKLNSKLLDNVMVARITNTSQQINYFKNSTSLNFGLIVIDNVSELFSFEYSKEEQALQKIISFMDYMHELSLLAIDKQIPIILVNTIRNNNEQEIENLSKAINFFTHIKIRLSKNNSKYFGHAENMLNSENFSFIISSQGLRDTHQSI